MPLPGIIVGEIIVGEVLGAGELTVAARGPIPESSTAEGIVLGVLLLSLGCLMLIYRERRKRFDQRIRVLPPSLASNRRYITWVYIVGPVFLAVLGALTLVGVTIRALPN